MSDSLEGSPNELTVYRDFCAALLKQAGEIANVYFTKSNTPRNKRDGTIVTEADLAIERALRESIEKKFPQHQIFGEEEDSKESNAEWLWIIDPIDGTQNFANGIPTFGTIIGLFHRSTPVVSGISHPALGVTYLAAKGHGATKNGEPLRIRAALPRELSHHELWGLSSPDIFQRTGDGPLFEALCRSHPAIRIYYDCYAHTLAAEGALGAHLELSMKIWDVAATELLVTEAGGRFHYTSKPETLSRDGLYSAVFGKPEVVSAVLDALGAGR